MKKSSRALNFWMDGMSWNMENQFNSFCLIISQLNDISGGILAIISSIFYFYNVKWSCIKEAHVRLTTLPLKSFSGQSCERYRRFSHLKLFWIKNCAFKNNNYFKSLYIYVGLNKPIKVTVVNRTYLIKECTLKLRLHFQVLIKSV